MDGPHGLTLTPAIGMGCSRLGSVLARSSAAEAAEAVRAALDAGIGLFDTANIYGQGSSELILGRTLPARGVEICTKAGFVTPAPLWMLRMVKPALRAVASRRGGVRSELAQRRSQGYPQRFDAVHLARSLNGSMRRLRRDRVDVFLLHNPKPDEAVRDDLWLWVETELARGRIGAFGISCAGTAADRVWLDHAAVTVAQIPASSAMPSRGGLLADPRADRLRLMLREIVGPGQHTTEAILTALQAIGTAPPGTTVVLGMSSAKHVREIAARFPVSPRVPAADLRL
jgi:aryl-alcohol dehydrogenase-like predicted oxidoreductase